MALATDGNGLAVVDAGGDAGLDGLAALNEAGAMAVLTGLVDDLALAAALGAGGGGGEDTHGGLPPHLDSAGAVAVRAHLRRGAGGAAVAVAGVTGLHPLHGDGLLTAEGRLFEADGHGQADALAPLGGVGVGAPSAAKTAAEEAAEDVAQVAEVEAAVESTAATGAEVGIHTGVAKLVVPGLLVGIGQDLVGLVDLLEFLLGVFVAGVQVRMILPGHLFICFFDLILGRALGHAQDLIIISFLLCHNDLLSIGN